MTEAVYYPTITKVEPPPKYPLMIPDSVDEPTESPIADDHQPLLQEEEKTGDVATSRRSTLKRKVKKALFKTDLGIDLEPAINPDLATEELPSLTKLIVEGKPTTEIKQKGFDIDSFCNEGGNIDTFYEADRTLYDLRALMPNWNHLFDIGFNKNYLGSKWSIDDLCTAYGMNKAQVCTTLGFSLNDFLRAGTPPDEYKTLGIFADGLVAMQPTFEDLFAMHLSFKQFVSAFGIEKQHVLEMKLTKPQMEALSTTRGWNLVNLNTELGMTAQEIQALGLGFTFNPSLVN